MQLEKYEKRTRQRVAKSTLSTRLSGQRSLQEFMGEDREPTVEDVEEWADHMIDKVEEGEIAASTVREYYKAISYYFETILGEEDAIDHVGKWLPTARSDPGEHLTEEEWDALRECTYNFRNRAYLEIMYHYSRRPMEVLLLNMEDVDLEGGTITFPILKKRQPDMTEIVIRPGEEKERKFEVMRATFEMDDEVEKHLNSYLKYRKPKTETILVDGEGREVEPLFTSGHGRLSYGSIWKFIKDSAENAGIEKNVTPKTMRHSRATHLDWDGHAPGNIARDMLIHDPDTDVVGRYIHDRDEGQVRKVLGSDKEEDDERE